MFQGSTTEDCPREYPESGSPGENPSCDVGDPGDRWRLLQVREVTEEGRTRGRTRRGLTGRRIRDRVKGRTRLVKGHRRKKSGSLGGRDVPTEGSDTRLLNEGGYRLNRVYLYSVNALTYVRTYFTDDLRGSV